MLPRPSSFQFRRTRSIRFAVYRMGQLALRKRILDVGAGEGLVAAEMAARTGRRVFALDLAPAPAASGRVVSLAGDAAFLPFRTGSLEAVVFHFVLLWLRDPVAALEETARVLAPGGVVLLLSEPDVSRRRDEPDRGLGVLLEEAVTREGGHPDAGSRLGGWLEEAGFRPSLQRTPRSWLPIEDPREVEEEVAFLGAAGTITPEQAVKLAGAERRAVERGARRVLLPLTYGIGRKTEP